MRIGDVAERTGVATRMIRYYESQGLLEPGRGPNGYRVYDEDDVDRVRRIRNHIAAGVPTRLIQVVFDMEKPSWTRECSRELASMLNDELHALDERIACLSASRETLRGFLATAQVTADA
ncbi:MerR family transcriptional regulator [Nocardioides sp. CER19]|uniref:MerR family transcriptional regulator n=1 Tax=Nocardioides sp. CER19 TaxID=3038538 RepID=UPI00244ABD7E|nr:MerR family transcriptional regulator [Nocardioides sp. CER19]MDH2415206.1 MerR family transcriptional regulator [Nocardioides sp. CER19]